MKFTIICNLLLFLGCFKLFGNWEIPIRLGFDPFEVVRGFPTLVDSFFENFFEKTAESSKNTNFPLEDLQYTVVTPQFRRHLNWSCPILDSSSQCLTVVKSSECIATSQLSYGFWGSSEDSSECLHRLKGMIDCKTPFQSGNICENVVIRIHKSGNNSIFFEQDDVSINTQIIQNRAEHRKTSRNIKISRNSTEDDELAYSNICQNYSIHETVLFGGENDTDILPFFQFGVNSTNLLKSMGCTLPFPSNVFLCNCRNAPLCHVPILYVTPNATFCGSTTISIYHTHGYIYSAIVTSSSELSSESQKHTVFFFDIPQTVPNSKFDLKRGRFHCPSETTCITEIFYPFRFLTSLELPYQIGILIFSTIIGLVIIANINEK